MGLLVETIGHFAAKFFLLLSQRPDSLILEVQQLDPTFVLLHDELPLGQLSWHVIGIHIHARFDRLGYEILSLFLEVPRPEQEWHNCLWSRIALVGSDRVEVCQLKKLASESIDGFKVSLKISHLVVQNSKFPSRAGLQPFQHLAELNLGHLLDSILQVSKFVTEEG